MYGPTWKEFVTFMSVAAVGVAGVGAAVGYGTNKLYFEPNARAAEFNQRAQNVLAARNLRTISVEDFKQGDDGCAKPLYGAKFVAESTQGQVVRGAVCVSRSTEMTLRIARP